MDFFKKREKKKGPVQKPVLDFEIDNQVEEDVVPVLLSVVAHTIERG